MNAKKIISTIASVAAATACALSAVACSSDNKAAPPNTDPYEIPQDYCRTYYEVFVRSFADGNGDGIGDIRGLINNLDYLNDGDDSTTEDLGVNGIWLMPINTSPSYHKYDVDDYYGIDDEYGTLEDFDELVEECTKRGIWIQMDLVLNHTSSDHQWFKNAVKDARNGVQPVSSEWMQRYEIMYSSTRPQSSRDVETWYQVPGTKNYWYLGNFSSNMPDLNLANEDVREDIKDIVDFWLERGVHSFRLDAVPWAFAEDDSPAQYGRPENIEFWTWFNDYCNSKGAEVFGKDDDGINRYCYNVGEVWAGKNLVVDYFQTGMTSFNYSLGGGITASGYPGVINERVSAYAIAADVSDIQTKALAYDENAILSNFLSNHDNDRSAGYFKFDPTSIKKAAALYMLMPGNPYIYYGEEIGAAGSGIDENKRLAFNWGDKSKGLTTNPSSAKYDGTQQLGTWKEQNTDPNSILTFYRNVIKLRNRFPEIGRGLMVAYGVDASGKLVKQSDIQVEENRLYNVNGLNEYIVAYTLTWKDRTVLIVHNVGSKTAEVSVEDFGGYSVVGELKTSGGEISLGGGALSMPAGSVAVLKAV